MNGTWDVLVLPGNVNVPLSKIPTSRQKQEGGISGKMGEEEKKACC